MTQESSPERQPSLEELKAQQESTYLEMNIWEDEKIAGVWDTKIDFPTAIKLSIGYMMRVIKHHEVSLQVLESEAMDQEAIVSTQSIIENKRLLIENAKKGIYSPLKKHIEAIIALRAHASQIFAFDGNEEKAKLYTRLACGFMGIMDALPDRAAPFHKDMLE